MDDISRARYKRLPGKGPRKRGFTLALRSRCTLHMGEDHILAVDNQGFSEDYKRFYFSDIQAIVTRKTKRGAVWNIILVCMIACSLAGALLPEDMPVRVFFWALSGTFLAFLVINLLRGTTCSCNIVTAVQEDLLPSLNRLRTAQKVIDILRHAIEEAQGRLTPEEVIARSNNITNRPRPSESNIRQSSKKQKPVLRHYDGAMHMLAFTLMLADGIAISIDLLHHTRGMIVASLMLSAFYWIMIIIALVKQYGSDIPKPLRGLTWTSLVFICVVSFVDYITIVALMVSRGPKEISTQWDMQWGMYRTMLDISPQSSPYVMALYGFTAACSLILGTLGLIRVMNHRSASAAVSLYEQNRTGNP
jgi:hypothetical protein